MQCSSLQILIITPSYPTKVPPRLLNFPTRALSPLPLDECSSQVEFSKTFPIEFILNFHPGNSYRSARVKWLHFSDPQLAGDPVKLCSEGAPGHYVQRVVWIWWPPRAASGGKVQFWNLPSAISAAAAGRRRKMCFPSSAAEKWSKSDNHVSHRGRRIAFGVASGVCKAKLVEIRK